MPQSNDDLFLHSSLREGMLEHLFVGKIMQTLWQRGLRDFEVLHPITDAAGYDIVICANGIMRHIQLKSSARLGKTSRQKINNALSRHASACIIWMQFSPETMDIGPYGWFGGAPGAPLPDLGDRIATHTKPNALGIKAERKNIRVLNKGDFEWLDGLNQIIDRLFGP